MKGLAVPSTLTFSWHQVVVMVVSSLKYGCAIESSEIAKYPCLNCNRHAVGPETSLLLHSRLQCAHRLTARLTYKFSHPQNYRATLIIQGRKKCPINTTALSSQKPVYALCPKSKAGDGRAGGQQNCNIEPLHYDRWYTLSRTFFLFSLRGMYTTMEVRWAERAASNGQRW